MVTADVHKLHSHQMLHVAIAERAKEPRTTRGDLTDVGEKLQECADAEIQYFPITRTSVALYLALQQLSATVPLYFCSLEHYLELLAVALQRARLHARAQASHPDGALDIGEDMVKRMFEEIMSGLTPDDQELLIVGYVSNLQALRDWETPETVHDSDSASGYKVNKKNHDRRLIFPGFVEEQLDKNSPAFAWLELANKTKLADAIGSEEGHQSIVPWLDEELWSQAIHLHAKNKMLSFRLFYKQSSAARPILLTHQRNIDVVGVLERLGNRYEPGHHKCRSISLTLVSLQSIRRTVERAMREGGWVLVHGCHAGVEVDHVKALAMIKSVNEGKDIAHPGFRLWLASERNWGLLPPSVVGACTKIYYDWGDNVKANMVQRLELVAAEQTEVATTVGAADATIILHHEAVVQSGEKKHIKGKVAESKPLPGFAPGQGKPGKKDFSAWRAPMFLVTLLDIAVRPYLNALPYSDSDFLAAMHTLNDMLHMYGDGVALWKPLTQVMVENVYAINTYNEKDLESIFDVASQLLQNTALKKLLPVGGVDALLTTNDMIQFTDHIETPKLPKPGEGGRGRGRGRGRGGRGGRGGRAGRGAAAAAAAVAAAAAAKEALVEKGDAGGVSTTTDVVNTPDADDALKTHGRGRGERGRGKGRAGRGSRLNPSHSSAVNPEKTHVPTEPSADPPPRPAAEGGGDVNRDLEPTVPVPPAAADAASPVGASPKNVPSVDAPPVAGAPELSDVVAASAPASHAPLETDAVSDADASVPTPPVKKRHSIVHEYHVDDYEEDLDEIPITFV
jgi:hypothetical protein